MFNLLVTFAFSAVGGIDIGPTAISNLQKPSPEIRIYKNDPSYVPSHVFQVYVSMCVKLALY